MEGYRHPLKLYDIWSYDSNYIELHRTTLFIRIAQTMLGSKDFEDCPNSAWFSQYCIEIQFVNSLKKLLGTIYMGFKTAYVFN